MECTFIETFPTQPKPHPASSYAYERGRMDIVPEKKMWCAVLILFLKDMQSARGKLEFFVHRFEKCKREGARDRASTQADRCRHELRTMRKHLKDGWMRTICEYADQNYHEFLHMGRNVLAGHTTIDEDDLKRYCGSPTRK